VEFTVKFILEKFERGEIGRLPPIVSDLGTQPRKLLKSLIKAFKVPEFKRKKKAKTAIHLWYGRPGFFTAVLQQPFLKAGSGLCRMRKNEIMDYLLIFSETIFLRKAGAIPRGPKKAFSPRPCAPAAPQGEGSAARRRRARPRPPKGRRPEIPPWRSPPAEKRRSPPRRPPH